MCFITMTIYLTNYLTKTKLSGKGHVLFVGANTSSHDAW